MSPSGHDPVVMPESFEAMGESCFVTSRTGGTLGLVTLLLLAPACRQRSDPLPLPPERAPRSLLLVVVDTLRQDHLQCYGYERRTAPILCGLAADGARADGLSPTAWTKPAVATLFTGLHPLRHQAIERDDRLPATATTLAETLAQRGFRTLGTSASGWVSEAYGFGQGFDALHFVPLPVDGKPPDGGAVNARLLPLLESLADPFFLYVHYVDPHDPYDPRVAWDGTPLGENLRTYAPLAATTIAELDLGKRRPTLLQPAIDLYDGEVRSVDESIGELLERMSSLGLLQRTLVVVTADHGEELQEHGRAGHGHSLFREVTRVPLLLRAPDVIPAGVELGEVGLEDVLPTILDLLATEDGSTVAAVDGDSFARALLRPASARRSNDRAVDDGDAVRRLLHLDLDGRAAVAALDGPYKLVLASRPFRKELYRIDRDRDEQQPIAVAGDEADAFRDLAVRMTRHYNRLAGTALAREIVPEEGEREVESLRALGYVGDASDDGAAAPPGRVLPGRIRTAEPPPEGLLGWEQVERFAPCVEGFDPPHEAQFLDGWYEAEPRFGGRWMRRRAHLALAALQPLASLQAPLPARLRIAGFRPDTTELRVFLDDALVATRTVGDGPWQIEVELDPPPRGGAYLPFRFEVASLAPAGPNQTRDLGLFIRSICLEPLP